jgi:hypothetical protein
MGRTASAFARGGITPPPVPLILAGWAYSNDVEKRNRWQETLAWVHHHGLGTLLSDSGDDSMHVVSELSDERIGPLGGPVKLDWSFDPKPDVDAANRERAVEALQSNWSKVVGIELGAVTSPWLRQMSRLHGGLGRRSLMTKGEGHSQHSGQRSMVPSCPLKSIHIDFVFDSKPTDC